MRIGIIGAGPTGIGIAHEMAKKGHDVHLFEKTDQIGGLACYMTIGESTVEKYYHFIMTHDKPYLALMNELGIDDRLSWVETKTNFFANDKIYEFTSPFDLLKFGAVGLVSRFRFIGTMAYLSKLSRNWKPFEKKLACEWLPRWCGRQAWDTIFHPMFQMKFGSHADEMSMSWLWARSRMISQYREKGVSKEKRAWLKGSSKTFLEAVHAAIEKIGGKIHLNSNVEQILVEEGKAAGIRADGENVALDKVVYSAPSIYLKDLLPDGQESDYFKTVFGHKYYSVVCMVMDLNKTLSDYFWTYVSDPRIPFVGVINYGPFTSWEGHQGHDVLYIPWYCEPHEAPYTTDDDELFRKYVDGLKLIWPQFDESWVNEWRVMRGDNASLICKGEYSKQIVGIKTPIEDLYFANMSQIYPQDRGISVGLGLSLQAAQVIETNQDIHPEFTP